MFKKFYSIICQVYICSYFTYVFVRKLLIDQHSVIFRIVVCQEKRKSVYADTFEIFIVGEDFQKENEMKYHVNYKLPIIK